MGEAVDRREDRELERCGNQWSRVSKGNIAPDFLTFERDQTKRKTGFLGLELKSLRARLLFTSQDHVIDGRGGKRREREHTRKRVRGDVVSALHVADVVRELGHEGQVTGLPR